MRHEPKDLVASVQARLLQRTRALDVEHQLTLARFGGERLLYRLSKSEFADRFIVKGAALQAAANDGPWPRIWNPGGLWMID